MLYYRLIMAGGIAESTVDEIKARTSLADLIASYGIAVKQAGASRKACCPFHHEKTPSFHINESKGFYHCFGCGESGDAIKFVQKMDGLTFIEAVKKLADSCGVKIEETGKDPTAGKRKRLYALLSEIAQFYRRCLLKTKEAETAREYLKSRDLGEKIQEDYLIGYAVNGVANILKWAEKNSFTAQELEEAGIIKTGTRPGDLGYHRFSGRLMFTIRDRQGRVVGFSGRQLVASKNSGKYVNSPETEVFKKSKVLYGFDKAAGEISKTPKREAIICEGQIDCIRLQTSGFPNAVAGQGTAFTDEHVKMLAKVADQVALVYDDDAAGRKATIKSARLCLAAGLPVRVVSLPEGDDPDSFLRANPSEAFGRLLDGAESILSFQIRAARAAETRPDTVDAVARITRELLTTIAQCPNAVVKAAMTDEAAGILGLPAAALASELGRMQSEAKLKPSPKPAIRQEVDNVEVDHPLEQDDPLPGGEAADETPPPPREIAFCSFLLANEHDACVDGVIGNHVPRCAIAHDFTARFIETWREEAKSGEDLFGKFSQNLTARERVWFDRIVEGSTRSDASELGAADIAKDFVRSLWMAALTRERGELPAGEEGDAAVRRLEISTDLKRLAHARWSTVKELISRHTKGV